MKELSDFFVLNQIIKILNFAMNQIWLLFIRCVRVYINIKYLIGLLQDICLINYTIGWISFTFPKVLVKYL